MQWAFVVSDLYATRNWYEHDTCLGIQKTSLFTIISGLYPFQVLFIHIYTVHLSILRFTSLFGAMITNGIYELNVSNTKSGIMIWLSTPLVNTQCGSEPEKEAYKTLQLLRVVVEVFKMIIFEKLQFNY